jgi:ABC-type taurine transport system substrate-binding protein/outer membrane protein OmpA-like peptidoglycan-associated protein
MKRLVIGLVGVLISAMSFSAPKYIEFKPIEEVVRVPVGNVNTSGSTLIPIITWGGDLATIHANGDSRNTQAGSIFDKAGLKFKLQREDSFTNQVKNYQSGKTPYLRGTLGMINSAAELLNRDARTTPVVIYQLTWSVGGDALVVKNDIKTATDLRGKTIALQAYGPHVDYLSRVLQDAGLKTSDVKIKWLPDLTGTDNSPMSAFYESDIDAAFLIIPDALALTSGGNVGTGSEDSVRGAKIMLSTKTANRVISDVYAVRSDFLKSNKPEVQAFVAALMEGAESIADIVSNRNDNTARYKTFIEAGGDILLDSSSATADTEGLYADVEQVFFNGNKRFFDDSNYQRSFSKLNKEIQAGLVDLGVIKSSVSLVSAGWNYSNLKGGLINTAVAEKSKFDSQRVAQIVSKKQQQNSLDEAELFSFEVFFKPNQNSFSADLYSDNFAKVIGLASAYGGAIITVEGHSDPMGYLKAKKSGSPAVVLSRTKQAAKNLSLTRSQAVRDSVISYAGSKNISLDPAQFAVVGHGITQPSTGVCGSDPCAPKTKDEWLSNMRVQFRIIQVEAESNVFQPL